MSILYLVRHGQASFGAVNYDQLSDNGAEQSRLLGAWFKRCGIALDHVVVGGQQRHLQTAESFFDTYGGREQWQPRFLRDADFNEVDFDALLKTHMAKTGAQMPLAPGQEKPGFAEFKQIINEAYLRWTDGQYDHDYGEPWPVFFQRCYDAALRAIALANHDQIVLAFTSGGTITTICRHVMGLSAEQMAIMMWRITNSSVTRIEWDGERFMLSFLNSTAHLDETGHRELHTVT